MVNIVIKNKQLTITDDAPELTKVLMASFTSAVNHRRSTGIDDRIMKDLRQATSQYDPKTKDQFTAKQEPDVYFPLGAMKARAQSSWMRDTVAGAIEKMWVGTPTPIPELPLDVSSHIRDGVFSEIDKIINQNQVFGFEDLVKIVNNLVDEQVDREYQEAKERSDRMSRVILDQWVEGNWLDTWGEVASDLSRCRVAIVKGPVEINKRDVSWSASGGIVESYTPQPIMYRVAPENFYPLGDVTHDVDSGSGIYELSSMSRAELYQAKTVKSYNADMLQELLDTNPNGWSYSTGINHEVDCILNKADVKDADEIGSGVYHTIKYYGKIQVKYLKEDDAIDNVPDSLGDDEFVNIEAWLIKDKLIYLNIEPYPLGARPFSVIPREFAAGSIWGGESLQSMIETPARIINALVRQQILNMGYAAGPIGEAEANRFPGGPPAYLEPRKVYTVNPSQQGTRALRFTDITPRTQEYISTINFYLTQADTLSGIPSYIEGAPGAERNSTLGQTGFYYDNASKGINALLGLIDKFLIEPMLKRYYYRNLNTIKDDSIKGDIKWRARGLSGVFNKQSRRDQSIAAVQLLGQLREVMPSYVTEDSFLKLVSPVFENIGLDIDEVLVKNDTSQADTSTPSPTAQQDTVNQVVTSIDRTPTENTITSSP